jgi:Xaa-Pro aminopeptidase
MQHPYINPSLFIKNRAKLRALLLPDSAVVLFSNDMMPRSNDQYYKFRQNSGFFYLTGINQAKSILLICPQHPEEHLREVLLVVRSTNEEEVWNGCKLSPDEASELSGISTVRYSDDYVKTLYEVLNRIRNVYLLIPEDPRFPLTLDTGNIRMSKAIREKFPLHSFHRLSPLLTRLRMIKEPEEIAIIKQACHITLQAFQRVRDFIRPGVMEYEIEAEITHEFIKSGANGHAYDPIIASGKNACILHYTSNKNQCRDGDLVLMDFGAEYLNYAADLTRTIPVNGTFTDRQLEIYDASKRVFRTAVSMMKPGVLLSEIHQLVGEAWEEEHIHLGLYTRENIKENRSNIPLWQRYYMHGTSHSIGLDVHDEFDKSMPLAPGMVLSCEPAIYIPEENIGIRIEDMILITKKENENLMGEGSEI